ncbi:ABC transporter permease [Thermotoga sp. 38H-to]|jgi:peptide/nickel transport system permease protein|uniref:ABC transporter permease n=1 Tax=Thermotoga sp. 38H-to TaxID=1755812 RepID=UPI000405A7F3|nr:ABC transporter permease [Thermotoga sp. 38H-to]KAF2959457.1 ABC transporter permease [Thermotoga sp. 38H-to]
MKAFLKYVIVRFLVCIVLIFIGVTITFLIPRLIPGTNPAEIAIRRLQMAGTYLPPESVEKMRESLLKLYGVEGTIFEQYIRFWRELLRGNLGPSFASFPTPVMKLISNSLPWTVGLLAFTTLVSWILGTILGGIAGFKNKGIFMKVFEIFANAVRPIPYYILALLLLVLFSYVLQWFPTGGAYQMGLSPSFSWDYLKSVIKHGFLPALSLIIIGVGGWFLNMRNLVSSALQEDFVHFAFLMRLRENLIFRYYTMKPMLPPQLTGLALQLGMIFNGTIITEIVFNYPGLGQLIYTAIMQSDYNLVMGITLFSVIAVALATFLIDITLPFVDPRIQYSGSGS